MKIIKIITSIMLMLMILVDWFVLYKEHIKGVNERKVGYGFILLTLLMSLVCIWC